MYGCCNVLGRLTAVGCARVGWVCMLSDLCGSCGRRNWGKLGMDVVGPDAGIVDDSPSSVTWLHSLFLFTRADTIYGGTNQIQRTIIAERALGMPREPRGES